MPKFITLKLEETYQIPDEWELVTNEEGITKLKVGENEFYDFGSMPYCAPSVDSEEEMMLTPEEFLDLQNRGLEILLADGKISEEKDLAKIEAILNEEE